MKTNLFLLAIIVAGGWYMWNLSPAPPEAPAPVAPRTVYRSDYSGVRTFYSTLNDPAVPVGGNYGTSTIYGSSNGSLSRSASSSSSLSLGATAPVGSGGSTQSTVSQIGPRPSNYGNTNGEPTLNIKQRVNNIGDAAKGGE